MAINIRRFLWILTAPALIGCGHTVTSVKSATTSGARPAAAAPTPQPPPKPVIDVAKIKPNELGYIPVLMYHAFGAQAEGGGARYDRNGLNIAPETFRTQLEQMYEAGWYPVNMRDALSSHIDVPAGKIPVVLTFDDARGTQLYYTKDGSLDPDCAVAIMEAFHAEHPDWPLRGSFYVLPKSRWNPTPFYQPGQDGTKLQRLLDDGFEIANHSTSHRRMDRMDAHTLAWEMAECIRYVRQRTPKATMNTMALPMGYVPHTSALLDVVLKGSEGGTDYQNLCILRAWGGPTLPPMHKNFDRKKVLRIGAEPGYIEGWIKRLKRGSEMEPFVSDGDPNTVAVPRRLGRFLDKGRLGGAEPLLYDDAEKKPEPKKAATKRVID